MNISTKRLTYGIMLALVVWGVYLAIGATGYFVQASATNPRKSVIVLICVAAFLGLWTLVLSRRVQPQAAGELPEPSPASIRPWSKAGLITVGFAIAGLSFWLAGIATWQSIDPSGTTILGWIAGACMMGSSTSGIIALSSREPKRGKWLGWTGLLSLAGSLLGFVARMSP